MIAAITMWWNLIIAAPISISVWLLEARHKVECLE